MSERGVPQYAASVRAHWRTIMLVVVAVLGAGVVGALIIILGDATRERDRAFRAQSHSYEVMILTRSLAGTMARAEATLGRFVISGDNRIGQQYSDEWVQAGQMIDRLDATIDDNPQQAARVFALRTAYRARGEELQMVALSTSYGQNSQALARYYQARMSDSLGQINKLLDGFLASERAVLRQRSIAARQTLTRADTMTRILSLVGGLIVVAAIVLGWLTARATRDRAKSIAEAETERERAEELEAAVAAATDRLHAEARERAAAEAQLSKMQKLEAVGQLTGGIAHDFNNMLAVVLGGIELARRRVAEGSKDVDRHLESAADGAGRAAALTRRLLAFARSEPLLPQSLDPMRVIAGMSDLLDRTLGDGIRLTVLNTGSEGHVWMDPHGLENAVLNLAVNARDAMDGRGRLTITTGHVVLTEGEVGQAPAGPYATIAVADTGSGMSAEVLERVFEPFFTTKPVGKGTGLGLSQIFGFVQQSHGEIVIRSVVGQGTIVTLYLPLHAAIEPVAVRPVVARIEPVAHTVETGLDVLVVEDDPRVRAATTDLLAELGHRPVPCGDPLEAPAMLAQLTELDLIISDVIMPGKNGPELIAELRPMAPGVGVILVTGFAGDAADHDDFGGYKVLRKPFTIRALEAAIDEAMAAREVPVAKRRAHI